MLWIRVATNLKLRSPLGAIPAVTLDRDEVFALIYAESAGIFLPLRFARGYLKPGPSTALARKRAEWNLAQSRWETPR